MAWTERGMIATLAFLLSVAIESPAGGQEKPAPEKEKKESAAQAQEKAADPESAKKDVPVPSNRRLNEWGVLPTSTLHDGGINLPPGMRVPEEFQYRRPDLQPTEADLTGMQLPPLPIEYKVLTKQVKPGDEVRVIAKVVSPYNKALPFVSLFYNWEIGRAANLYVNFKPDKKDKTLFRGRGKVSKWAAPGRYVAGTTIMADEAGHRKAYWADFNPAMQEEDGSPAGFEVLDNPNADTEAPTLKSIEIDEKAVKAGEDLIHFTMVAEDNLSGPVQAEAIWLSPTGDQSIRAAMVMLGNQPGVFKGAFAIPEWYEGGPWKLMRIGIDDNAGNTRYHFEPTEPIMKGKAVQVLQSPEKVDKVPPRLLAVQLSTDESDIKDPVTITALVEDNLSGIEGVNAMFLSPNGADSTRVELKSVYVPLNRPSVIPQPTIYTGTLQIKKTQERGNWRLVRLNISDRAQNYHTYFEGRDPIVTGITVKFFGDEEADAETTTEGRK